MNRISARATSGVLFLAISAGFSLTATAQEPVRPPNGVLAGVVQPRGSTETAKQATTLGRVVVLEAERLARASTMAQGSTAPAGERSAHKGNWIQRHPVLFGTAAGFGAGFLIGYLPGDDAVFEDFTASSNGVVIGGIGAGAGALVGATISR
jgi:hypothetical protein